MRLKQKEYEATLVDSTKDRKNWRKCRVCGDWVLNEKMWHRYTAFGPVRYNTLWSYNGDNDHYFCTACCHQPIDVINWIDGEKATISELYALSKKQHVKEQTKANRKAAAAKRKRAAKKGGKR